MRSLRPWAFRLFACLAVLTAGARPARAVFIYEVEVETLNGAPLAGTDSPKSVSVSAGDVLGLRLYAFITGAPEDPASEGFQGGYFSLRSSHGGGIGVDFLAPAALTSVYAGSPATAGLVQDLDGDGDLDLGSNASSTSTSGPVATSALSFIRPRAAAVQTAGRAIPDGTAFEIGAVRLAITGAEPAGSITVNAVLPKFLGINRAFTANWQEDELNKTAFTGILGVGSPVILTGVPEPGAGLLALGGLFLIFGKWRPAQSRPRSRNGR